MASVAEGLKGHGSPPSRQRLRPSWRSQHRCPAVALARVAQGRARFSTASLRPRPLPPSPTETRLVVHYRSVNVESIFERH